MTASLRKRINSFRSAFKGLSDLFSEEPNARIHLVITILVIAAAIISKLSVVEWLVLVLTISLVFVAETINTAVEKLADMVQPEMDERIRKIKDLTAAAVLISAVGAATVGLIIFLPRLLRFVGWME